MSYFDRINFTIGTVQFVIVYICLDDKMIPELNDIFFVEIIIKMKILK